MDSRNRIINFLIKRKELLFVLSLMLVYFIHRFISYNLGLYMEECRDAEAHLMVLKGQLPYTDPMSWFYGPFAFCVYPLIFKIFGVNLVVFRLSYVIIASFVIPCVYYLARRLMPSMWAGLAAFLATLLIDVPYYTYNHILATIAGLFALLFIVRFIEHFDNFRNLFLAGIFVGITLLVKPFLMGFGILFSIILFILFLKFKKAAFIKIKLIHIIMLFFGLLTILTPFLLYFAIHKNLYKFLMHIMPIGLNRASGFYAYSATFTTLREHWGLLKTIIPYKILFSPSQWRAMFVQSYDSLILFSPIIFPLIIVLLNKFIFHKYCLISKDASIYFLLFALFSLFISSQTLFCHQQVGRSFTMQIPFLLIAYFLFLINNKKIFEKRIGFRYVVSFLTFLFIFYLSFLHFFRYPYSRYKKYIVPLEVERARGIKVTYREKELYEALDKFLLKNLKADEVIGILGHCPTLSFLSQRQNIFDGETISLKLSYLSKMAKSSLIYQERLKELEDYLINKLELKKPKFILEPIIFSNEYPRTRLNKYIDKVYVLDKTLGPAELDIYTPGIVKIYRLKE